MRGNQPPMAVPPLAGSGATPSHGPINAQPIADVSAKRIDLSKLPVVHIDKDRLRRDKLLPVDTQERFLRGQFRQIKRSILRNALKHETGETEVVSRTIMVTSALPGDGKTFSCLNLAMSLALERDCAVVLVDADVLKPHVSRELGAGDRPGLMDLLVDTSQDVANVITATNVPGLFFLPAGRHVDTATEYLSSKRMAEVLHTLTSLAPNILVLFDSPPLLLTSESRVLASLMQQILVVVKAGVTPQSAVTEAIDTLADASARAGIVLNNVSGDGLNSYAYGYGYAYTESSVKK